MESEEFFQSAWEESGSWGSRSALCGRPVYERMEAIRQAVLERCQLCSEPAIELENPFSPLEGIADVMNLISAKLKKILPYFVALDEGMIRSLTLILPDGSRKNWQLVPTDDFEDVFDAGSLAIKEGKISLSVTYESGEISLIDTSFQLYAECFSVEELSSRFPVFLPDYSMLGILGDWMFQIYQLLKILVLPKQEIGVEFRLMTSTGAQRNLMLLTSSTGDEWICNGEEGTGSLSETSAWDRIGEDVNYSNISLVQRLLTEYPGTGDFAMFGEGVPFTQLELFCSSWMRTEQNHSRKLVARSVEPLSVYAVYSCRHDPVDDLPFLSGRHNEGSWQILGEGQVAYGENFASASDSVHIPEEGQGARTDSYRRCTITLECTFDSCGLLYL